MGTKGLTMGRKQLKFFQICRLGVVQLEIHPFLTATHVGQLDRNWFNSQHMQELEDLLKPVLADCALWDTKTVRDKDMKKKMQTCLVGPTVRLGFTLKHKRERQSLLIRSSRSEGYQCSNIQSVKLVVYVCPRLHANACSVHTAFGKLLKNEDQTNRPDISSYFSSAPVTTTTISAVHQNQTITTAISGISSISSFQAQVDSDSMMKDKCGDDLMARKDPNGHIEEKYLKISPMLDQSRSKESPKSAVGRFDFDFGFPSQEVLGKQKTSLTSKTAKPNSPSSSTQYMSRLSPATRPVSQMSPFSTSQQARNKDRGSPASTMDRTVAAEVSQGHTVGRKRRLYGETSDIADGPTPHKRAFYQSRARSKSSYPVPGDASVGKDAASSPSGRRVSSFLSGREPVVTSRHRKQGASGAQYPKTTVNKSGLLSRRRGTCLENSKSSSRTVNDVKNGCSNNRHQFYKEFLNLPSMTSPLPCFNRNSKKNHKTVASVSKKCQSVDTISHTETSDGHVGKSVRPQASGDVSGRSVDPKASHSHSRKNVHLKASSDVSGRSVDPKASHSHSRKNVHLKASSDVSGRSVDPKASHSHSRKNVHLKASSDVSGRSVDPKASHSHFRKNVHLKASSDVSGRSVDPKASHSHSRKNVHLKASNGHLGRSVRPPVSDSDSGRSSPNTCGRSESSHRPVTSDRECQSPVGGVSLSEGSLREKSRAQNVEDVDESLDDWLPPLDGPYINSSRLPDLPRVLPVPERSDSPDWPCVPDMAELPNLLPVKMSEAELPDLPPVKMSEAELPDLPPVKMSEAELPDLPPVKMSEAELPDLPPVKMSEAELPDLPPVKVSEAELPDLPPVKVSEDQQVALHSANSDTPFSGISPHRHRGLSNHHKHRSQTSPENSSTPKRRRKRTTRRTPLTNLSENKSKTSDHDSDSCRHMSSVSDMELMKLTASLKSQMLAIASGTLHSQRHDIYRQGGQARRSLDTMSNLRYFHEGQEDVVMDVLITLFPRQQIQEMDYILRVLLPEAMARIYTCVTGRSLPSPVMPVNGSTCMSQDLPTDMSLDVLCLPQ